MMRLLQTCPVFVLWTFFFAICYMGSVDSKQCGEEFVRAIYQACGVARRAFSPIGHNLENRMTRKLENTLLEQIAKRSGGYFGQSNGGGTFSKRDADAEASRLPPNYLLNLVKDDIIDDGNNGEFGNPTNDIIPSSKLKEFDTLEQLRNYLKKTGQNRQGQHQREIGTQIQDQPIEGEDTNISSNEKRGNTAVNLMADYCCRHKCNWRTLVGICK